MIWCKHNGDGRVSSKNSNLLIEKINDFLKKWFLNIQKLNAEKRLNSIIYDFFFSNFIKK